MPDDLTTWDPEWKRTYSSPPDDLIGDFYVPALARSCRYDRAVGFFSSHLLAEIAPSVDEFVINGGTMRLITSPVNLSDDDLQAMGKGEEALAAIQDDLEDAASQSIPDETLTDRLKLLTWMIANQKLEVRIALREYPDCYALFHEKIGVFNDASGNWMTFTGSPNETMGGARRYSESFPLHRSWASESEAEYAEIERDRFEKIWSKEIEGIATWAVNDWIEQPMREANGQREPMSGMTIPKPPEERFANSLDSVSLLPALPDKLKLRDYQNNAVNAWLKEEGRGTFAMATGTGKTITALAAATQVSLAVAKSDCPLLILIIVPLIDLVEQWRKDAEWFGFRPAICHGNLRSAEKRKLRVAFSAARAPHGQRTEMVITTAGSLTPRPQSPADEHFLQRQLERHKGKVLVIGDEVHSLGTGARLKALPDNPTYTLGLSATPKRHGDENGTESLMSYFGDPVVSISIKEAIYDHKCLVEYDYLPSLILLTDDEAEKYRKLSASIAAAYANGDEAAAESYIRARTRVAQHAVNKKARLRELMADGLSQETHQIIYVAEGRHPESEMRQLEEIEEMLRDDFDMTVERYYGETPPEQRRRLQQRLANGEVQALLAMKCLDEGVDIPSVRIGVITASTQNPRQFVQRRGRLLRKDPNRPKPLAHIYDFIVLPPGPAQNMASDSEKTLIGAELSRAVELADAARNREVRLDIIRWAYQFDLDRDQYVWMSLEGEEEMEEWTNV